MKEEIRSPKWRFWQKLWGPPATKPGVERVICPLAPVELAKVVDQKVAELLAEAGWRPDRQAPVEDACQLLERHGYYVHPHALEFLSSFGEMRFHIRELIREDGSPYQLRDKANLHTSLSEAKILKYNHSNLWYPRGVDALFFRERFSEDACLVGHLDHIFYGGGPVDGSHLYSLDSGRFALVTREWYAIEFFDSFHDLLGFLLRLDKRSPPPGFNEVIIDYTDAMSRAMELGLGPKD